MIVYKNNNTKPTQLFGTVPVWLQPCGHWANIHFYSIPNWTITLQQKPPVPRRLQVNVDEFERIRVF